MWDKSKYAGTLIDQRGVWLERNFKTSTKDCSRTYRSSRKEIQYT